jgi:Short C-terminal domain
VEGSWGGFSIRPDIDEAFAELDPKAQASLTGLRTPRAVRKGLEKLPELIPDERVITLGSGKDPAVHPAAGATLGDVVQNTKSIRLLVVSEFNFWEVQAAGRMNGSRPRGIRTELTDIRDVRRLSERKLSRFGVKEHILAIDHLRGAQMETTVIEMIGSEETLARFADALISQIRQVGEALAETERTQAAPPLSVADELAKLSELRQGGVLSDPEFEAEKAKLLRSN